MTGRRVVLVTGASSGIGAATARCLADAGWRVLGASRSGTVPEGLSPECLAARTMDLTDGRSVESVVQRIQKEEGRLDAVVNAAGVAVAGPLEQTPEEEVRHQLDTNLHGAITLIRAVLPALRASTPSHLVQVSSLAAHLGLPYQSLYCAAKAGLDGLCESLWHEVRGLGVHVVLVEPGSVRTALTHHRHSTPASGPYADAARKALAVNDADEQGGIEPEVVARAILQCLGHPAPPLRVAVGRWSERIALPARRWLPASWFLRLLGSRYR